jgi:diguanylate cyclase (GGDEF)-like protein/PAS domain S-box-containing protein
MRAKFTPGRQPPAAALEPPASATVDDVVATAKPQATDGQLESVDMPASFTSDPTLNALFATGAVGVCLAGEDGTVIRVNQRLLDIVGIPADRIVGSNGSKLLDSFTIVSDRHRELLARHSDGTSPRIVIETTIDRPDGSSISIAGDSVRIQNPVSGEWCYLGLVEDTSDRHSAQRVQRNSEVRIQALVQNSSDIIGIVSEQGRLDYVTDSVERILGYDPASLLGRDILGLIAAECQPSFQDVFESMREVHRQQAQASARFIHANGSWRWMELDFTNLLDVPSVSGVVVTARDVTKRKTFEQQLERLAYYDTLTALPNRMHFRERLEAALANLDRPGANVAVVFLDLDRFKTINDRFGHDGGDAALVAVAQRILDALRPGELVARLGGDEFGLLIENTTPARAMHAANRVLAAISRKHPDQHHSFNLAATAGVALRTPSLNRPAEILRAADIALYKGKHAGGGVATLFQSAMYDEALARAELERDLRLALDRQEMAPWFQPELDLNTGDLCGFEVSMRWRRPGSHMLTPDAFLIAAAELGIIVPLGLSVLRSACKRLVEWSTAYHHVRATAIAFNVSAREIARMDYAERIVEILRETDLEPSRLRIEIEDRIFREPSPDLARFVAAIARFGIDLVVDEFGGGYTSWRQLHRWQVHQVKIARDAIAEEDDIEANVALLKGLTARASGSDITVSAVGLDTSDLVDRARDIGCDRGQGLHLGPPLPAEEVPALLARNGRIP